MALQLKSARQVQTELLANLIAQLGLTDINPGSVLDVLTSAISQSHFSLYYQIAQVSRLVDIDALTGSDLDNRAFEYGLTRYQPEKATGHISVFRPDGFVKVNTTFYAGSPSPVSGDTQIDVNDASNILYSTSGTLILGRGTNNEEEVPYIVAPVNNTTFWRFTLNAPLVKDHAVEETVILKQGNDEIISAGTVVIVPATGVSSEIQFETENDEVLLAGEYQLDNVNVKAVEPGTGSNISIGSIDGINAFPTPPFADARARNLAKITTGKDLETDDELRDRIKNYIQGITRATKQAILTAIVGLVDPETAKRVVSASIILPVETVEAVKVYIDDGTGFEPSYSSRGYESVLGQATGGEQRLQTDKFPVKKAQIENNSAEFYNMSSGSLTLIYQVSNISETITFNLADFRFPEVATAEEIVGVINDRATLIEARTSQVGTKVLITAKADTNENIQITGGTANTILNFPTDEKTTINLYKNDVKLTKDGTTAVLDSQNLSPYNLIAIGPFPHPLTLIVDGKIANPLTANLLLTDVVNPAAVTVPEILAALNRDLVGVEAIAIANNTKIRLISKTKLSTSSKIQVTGGSLNNTLLGLKFPTSEVVGTNGDYKLNRELGQIELNSPLLANDNVSANTLFTRGKHLAVTPELYAPLNGETLVVAVDGGLDQVITFDNTFLAGKTAAQTALFINQTLKGATALVRSIGGLNYLQIQTNTYDTSGNIQIKSASTSNGSFGFTLDTIAQSTFSSKAYLVSSSSGPYAFAENDSLVVVVNNDIVNSTYAVPMNYGSAISAATSGTVFSAFTLANIFQVSNILKDFYIAFKNGPNVDTSTVESVTPQGGGIARYTFNPIPVNMANFAVNDLFNAQDLLNSENNGYFIISAIGANYVDVLNTVAIATTGETGTGNLSQRRKVLTYNNITGAFSMVTGFTNTPVIGNQFILIPSTINNLVDFINNTKVSSISLKANVEAVSNNTKIQLTSKLDGSDGYIQVTGGNANKKLNFVTTLIRGLAAYSYATGLEKLVHKTIYGDDSDLASFAGYGASGVIFRVLAPTVKNLSVEIKVTLSEGVTVSSLENDIKSAITGYVNTLGVGEDVIIERIRAAVIGISGIIDVSISDPTENIVISDNEKAYISATDVLIG